MLRLLLVEDDADCAEVFRAGLVDFLVTDVRNKREAMEALRDGFDVVVADWRLPDGFGTEILEAAHAGGTYGVLVTGYLDVKICTEGKFTVLYKPVDMAKLAAVAKDAAARTELLRACA